MHGGIDGHSPNCISSCIRQESGANCISLLVPQENVDGLHKLGQIMEERTLMYIAKTMIMCRRTGQASHISGVSVHN